MGGSVLVVGEASGPSGGSAGMLGGATGVGRHPGKRKSVVMQRSRAMVVRRNIVFISTIKMSGFFPYNLSDLQPERNVYAF
jgi:hypothetical protein